MSVSQRDAGRLQAELAQLRAALRSVEGVPPDEEALRAQFRAMRLADAKRTAVEHGGRRRLPLAAAAAAAVVLAVAAALAALLPLDDGAEPAAAAAPRDEAPAIVGAFQPLLHSPGLPPSEAYSVVRVRIPLSALAVVPGTTESGTIEADLLVGEDGLARAIRFDEVDAMLVSVADQ
jgi:hypothetical protein